MSDRRRLVVGAITMTVVFASLVNVIWRTASSEAGSEFIDVPGVVFLLLLAAPSLTLIPLTRKWRIWGWICALATVGWLPLIGPGGDLSCTDCAFALLLPLNVALIQSTLLVVGLISPTVRNR
jgi:hypothetical protein